MRRKRPSAEDIPRVATRLFELAARLRRGEEIGYREIETEYNIRNAQARKDVAFLSCWLPLDSALRKGRKVFFLKQRERRSSGSVARAMVLMFARPAIHYLDGTVYADEISELVAELLEGLTPREQLRLARLSPRFLFLRPERALLSDRPSVVEAVLDGIYRNRILRFQYTRMYDNTRHEYRVEPHGVVVLNGTLQLVAVKLPDGGARLFNIDRIDAEVAVEKEWFESEPLNLERMFAHAVGRFGGAPPKDVTLLVNGPTAVELRSRAIHPSQRTCESDAGLTVKLHVGICPDLVRFLLGCLPDVVVVEPPELAEEVRRRAGNAGGAE